MLLVSTVAEVEFALRPVERPVLIQLEIDVLQVANAVRSPYHLLPQHFARVALFDDGVSLHVLSRARSSHRVDRRRLLRKLVLVD